MARIFIEKEYMKEIDILLSEIEEAEKEKPKPLEPWQKGSKPVRPNPQGGKKG